MIYSELNDVDLASLLKLGDKEAFTQIYQRYRGLLYIYACKITHDESMAEDLVHDLFINLWDKRATINFTNSVSSYLYTSIRYKFFDLLDRQKIHTNYEASMQSFFSSGYNATDSYMAEKELAAIIEREINNLPEKMREIFLLSRVEHLSNKEIAERLNISEKTVKNQISLALKILRVKISLFAFFSLFFW